MPILAGVTTLWNTRQIVIKATCAPTIPLTHNGCDRVRIVTCPRHPPLFTYPSWIDKSFLDQAANIPGVSAMNINTLRRWWHLTASQTAFISGFSKFIQETRYGIIMHTRPCNGICRQHSLVLYARIHLLE